MFMAKAKNMAKVHQVLEVNEEKNMLSCMKLMLDKASNGASDELLMSAFQLTGRETFSSPEKCRTKQMAFVRVCFSRRLN